MPMSRGLSQGKIVKDGDERIAFRTGHDQIPSSKFQSDIWHRSITRQGH
jgi:hypothetical protein